MSCECNCNCNEVEDLATVSATIQPIPQAPCPSCGYCPSCGRKNYPTTWYPSYHPYPTTTPYIWYTTTTSGISPNSTITYTN